MGHKPCREGVEQRRRVVTSASLGAGGGVRAREGTVVEVFTVVDLLNDECLCVSVCVCVNECVFVITCLPSTSTLFGNYY